MMNITNPALPPLAPQGRVGAQRERGRRESRRIDGAAIHYLFHRKEREDRKGFCWVGFAFFAFFAVHYYIKIIF